MGKYTKDSISRLVEAINAVHVPTEEEFRLRHEREKAELEEFEREIAFIKKHYGSPMFSPLMRWNDKYLTEEFKGMIPYICINDLVNYQYVICAIPKEEVRMMLMEMNRKNVVKVYDSLESMVIDGWRIDT